MEEEILITLICFLIFTHKVKGIAREKSIIPLPLWIKFRIFSSGIPFCITAFLNSSSHCGSTLSPLPVKSPCKKENCWPLGTHGYSWILLLLLLSRFSCVWFCATLKMAAHQALPSLGFSRQEHCSGLPFPFPMYESEKWKWIHSVVSDTSRPHGLQPTRLLRPWDFPGKSSGVGFRCLLWFLNLQNRKWNVPIRCSLV